jgi:hypothetical protein
MNDKVTKFPLFYRDAAGNIQPAPPGDVDSVTSSAPNSLAFAIGTLDTDLTDGAVTYPAGSPALVCTPLVQLSDSTNSGGSISAIITDTAGLPMAQPRLFDIGPDTAPASLDIDTTVSESTPQAVPAPTGP